MGNPGAVEKFLVPLQDLQEKDPLIWVVQGSRRWRGEILGSSRGLGEECCQGGGWSVNESFMLNSGGLYIPGRLSVA